MKVETDIDHTDLDDDGDEDTPETMVFVSIHMPDGMRYSGTVACEGTPSTPRLAEMLRQATEGAAATHSPQLGRLLAGGGSR
ncbi:hypothetical protein [Pseudonocardia zijingensis]|uniref:Uncharacterized protein n=1 Tax=Pseudonocardia zijingensis TaxID=153376 RepID=A0ABP3YLB3_9PSEU